MSDMTTDSDTHVHFVLPARHAWDDLLDNAPPPDPDAVAKRFINAVDVWVVQTYLHLRAAGKTATISTGFQPDAINVTSYAGLRPGLPLWKCFVVCAQHDRPRPALCHARVVQNKAGVQGAEDHYIPHWPQPGLQPRDPGRADAIRTLTFKGALDNLSPPYRDQAFLDELEKLGVTLETSDRADKLARGAVDWTDYREADLVLAVREAPKAKLDTKPPTKLINAWLAGTPALLGPESAYEQLRESELDYLEVRSPEDVIRAVESLRREPERYRAMIEHGARRGQGFNAEATTRRWTELLEGPIAEAFVRWRSASAPAKMLRLAGHPFVVARHAMQARSHRKRQRGQG